MATQLPNPASVIADVNSRIDHCVQDNAAGERILWLILSFLTLTGVLLVTYGVVKHNGYLVAGGLGEDGIISWPMLRLIQLYRRRIALSVIPAITALLSPRDAAREIHALVTRLLE